MKSLLRSFACGLFVLYMHGAWPQSGTAQDLDSIVAVVNSEAIMASELTAKVRLVEQRLADSNTQMPSRKVLRRQVLERLIMERLQLQVAKDQGIRVNDETLNDNLRDVARRNQMTLAEFRDLIQKEGFDYRQFREDVRSEIMITQLRRQLIENRVEVSALEVKHELENMERNKDQNEYRLGHILVAVPEAASPEQIKEAHDRAQSIVARLRNGADFRKLAVAESDGQQALEGGDLGWRKGGQLPTLFADKITAMQPGDVSEPIRSPSGFHVIKLLEQRGGERHVVSQTEARHILLRPDEITPEDQVRARLEQLKQRIENGEDFATLARSHSQDSVSAANGGALGWISPGDVVPAFEEALANLSTGEISEPFKTRFGWHIAEVLGHRQYDSTDAFRRARAREFIRKRKAEEETELWLRRLRDEAYVEYRDAE